MSKTLALLHTQADGSLPKAALETLTAAVALGQPFDVAILGTGASAASDAIQGCGGTRFPTVDDPTVAQPRYAQDTAPTVALIQAPG